MNAILNNPVIILLVIMIITSYVVYHISYYLTKEIEGSCFLAGGISVVVVIISLSYML